MLDFWHWYLLDNYSLVAKYLTKTYVEHISETLSSIYTINLLYLKSYCFGNSLWGVGEMAPQLKILIVLPENPGSIPSTHMASHNHL